MKTRAALLALAAATAVAGRDGDDGMHPSPPVETEFVSIYRQNRFNRHTSWINHLQMPGFRNPFARPATATGPSPVASISSTRSRKKPRSEGIVEPGRALSKGERDQIRAERADSAVDPAVIEEALNRQKAYEFSFNALGHKIALAFDKSIKPFLLPIWNWITRKVLYFLEEGVKAIDTRWPPSSCVIGNPPVQRRLYNIRTLIICMIAFLLVFGSLWALVEYLLFFARASACTTTTVFLPVTITAHGSSTAPDMTSTTDISSTSTSTHTVTSYVTLGASSETPPYVYTVDPSGSTVWINGVTPTGVSFITLTTSVFVTASDPVNGGTSTLPVASVTPPAYTSTAYSFAGPETTLTSTSTSTNTVTYTLSYATPGSMGTRSAFPGISSAGWNDTSSSGASASPTLTSSVAPESTTYTSVYFTSSGLPMTSTTTTFMTTTISRRITVTLQASSSEADPEATGSSSSGKGGRPLTLGSKSGILVGPESASMSSSLGSKTMLPIPTSLSTLLTISATGRSASSYPASSAGSLSTQAGSSSSTAGSSSLASPASGSGSSSSSVQITNTMSHAPPNESSSMSLANTWTSRYSNSSSGVSSSSTIMQTTHSPSTSGSSVVSSSIQSSPPSRASIAQTMGSSSHSRTKLSISSTMTGSKSSDISSTAGPAQGSGSNIPSIYGSNTAAQPTRTSASTEASIQSTSLHRHHTTTETTVSSGQPATGSSNSVAISKTLSSSLASSSSSADHSSASSSNSAVSGSSSVTITRTQTSSTSETKSVSTFSNPFPASSPTATPTEGCGEHGSFLVDFDNLPNFLPTNSNNTDITQAPPIESPYWHLTWSDGYVYAPQPNEPYTPISPPHLAVFLTNGIGKRVGGAQSGNFSKPGEISDGPREAISAFWFDAYSAWFGCDNRGPEDCTLIFSAFSWSPQNKTEILIEKSTSKIAPCNKSSGCGLSLVEFPSTFKTLSGLQIQAFVGNEERMFFMDDLSLKWTNSTCDAGLLRQSST